MTQTMVTGSYRLIHRDNNDNSLGEIVEINSLQFGGVLGTPRSDPSLMPKIKKTDRIIRQDDKLVIAIKPDTTRTEHSTSSAAADTVMIPVTIKNIRTGNVYEKSLTKADFTDKRSYVNSQVWTAGVWYDIWSLTLGAQLEMKVGHNLQDVRVDGAINIQKDVTTS